MNLTQMSESIHGLGHLTRAHRSSEPTQMKKPEELHEFPVGKNLPLRNCPRLLTNSSSQGACLLASWCWYRDAVLGFQCTAWCVCTRLLILPLKFTTCLPHARHIVRKASGLS
ncbi:hypothetical protein HBH95_135570 [Parastagonospora nodorum]|nr:hypothetical protein HBH95_135570 [Parastagonospora nodorum]